MVSHVPDSEEMKQYARTTPATEMSGPIEDRSCTDIFFLLLFIAFWVGMIVVAAIGFKTGDPKRLIHGTDSLGNVCGQPNPGIPNGLDMTNKPYLYFADPLNPGSDQICVTMCPTKVFDLTIPLNIVVGQTVFCYNFTGTPTVTQIGYIGCLNSCPCFPVYPTSPILNRCVPTPGNLIGNYTTTGTQVISKIRDSDIGRQLAADVDNSKYIILGMVGVALVLSFVWLILLRLCAACMVWLTILFVFAVLVCLTGFLGYEARLSYYNYNNLNNEGLATTEDLIQERTLIALAIIMLVVLVVFVVVLIFMRPRINLAIAIIKEASSAFRAVPFVLIVPPIIFVILAGFFAYWLAVWLYLNSAGTPTFNSQQQFVGYEDSLRQREIQIYHLFGLLWTTAFFLAMGEIVIAGSIAAWYFTRDKKQLSHVVVLRSWGRALRYHLGTIAFGSLLIAIVQFIRICIKYLQKRLKGSQFRIARFLLGCLGYCFACFERFLKFICRNAYIQTAIFGDSFCKAARDAFSTLMRNAARLIAVNFVGGFLLFLGKVFVTVLTGIIATYVLQYYQPILQLHYWALPLIIIIFFAYGVVTAFLSTFDMAIDTIFLCFCEDSERHDGSPGREPYYSDNLRSFVHNNAHDQNVAMDKMPPGNY